ncbi:MBL fold metallo-hydrolase [Larkinella rosea]|uniref:MBL fold metallo-hydrolase n=1 Tax=Larkinella rosea TaxID=2025312 RepID=A0A3P1BNZ8_9BACT|nr:MBL fold metallo-hydrolase [Larkinella rosea]RRB02817.1 MBL fold metallo-hydrolase [Larkinella rosea]
MPLFISSLNSGSNGNCYYVGNEREAVLIDVGISCRQAETRFRRLGLSLDTVKAIFISHEHTDHISGLSQLAGKYKIPVYITAKTLGNSRLMLRGVAVNPFYDNEPVVVGNLRVTAFAKHHDAADPHSFTVSDQHTNVGVFTDIGHPCERLVQHFSQCHAAFLEANYDDEMLERGRYPYFLKQRIRGGKGHLSNQQALNLFIRHKPAYMSHVLLAHLSQDNNNPELLRNLFLPHVDRTNLIVASRFEETPVFRICGERELV